MNVKPGDLAIQIKSLAGNYGAIVEIIEWIGTSYFISGHVLQNCWLAKYSHPVRDLSGEYVEDGFIPDHWLRPISGLPLDEETRQTEEA